MKKILIILSVFTFLVMLTGESFARAGKGTSSGFRSYKQQPQQPSQAQPGQQQNFNKPSPQAQAMPKQSFLNSGMFKFLVGGLFVGGLLSLLMGGAFEFGGMPGMIELFIMVLILILILKIVMKLVTRSWQKNNPLLAANSYTASGVKTEGQTDIFTHTTEGEVANLANEKMIKDIATSTFKLLQDAWSKNDLSIVKNLLTDRMYTYLDNQLQELKSQGLKNIVEIVYFPNVNIVDFHDEDDKRVVIVEINALIRDYTLDRNNKIVEGSKDSPVEIKEYWAFVGKALEWKLDDIKQV